jgi:hypothetical protein
MRVPVYTAAAASTFSTFSARDDSVAQPPSTPMSKPRLAISAEPLHPECWCMFVP